MPLRTLAAVAILLASAPAQAQPGPQVLALAPASPSPDWPGELAIELDYLGGRVLRSPLAIGPSSADPALSARVAAQVVGADAAVWLSVDGQRVNIALTSAEISFAAPVDADSDGRTIALVVASLLEEAFATAVATVPPLPISPHEQLDAPLAPVPQLYDHERPPVHRALREPRGSAVATEVFAALGTGGMALITDVSFDPGTLLRALLGVRIGEHFQLQANVEVGLVRERVGMNDGGLELQPFGRLCPEVAAVLPASRLVGFQIGAHGCVGVAELRHYDYAETSLPGAPDPWIEGAVVTVAGGGFLALEVRPTASTSVIFRADLDGSSPATTSSGRSVARQPDVVASFSTLVGFW